MLFTRVRDPSLSVSQIVNCSSWEEIIDVSSLSSREEISQLEYLKQIVNEVVLQDKEDRIIWVANNNCLTSAAVYQRLTEFSHNNRSWSQIWCMKIPPRIKVFLWQAEHNRLPTYDLLKRRSVRFENLCKWCNAEEETQAHLFFQCSLAKMGWECLNKWLEVSSWQDGVTSFSGSFQRIRVLYKHVSGSICLASMFWSIWIARNELIFRGFRISPKSLELAIKYRAFLWARAAKLISQSLMSSWAISPAHSVHIYSRKNLNSWLTNWLSIYQYAGFIDGSFQLKADGNILAGVGGVIINNKRLCKLVFSGPVEVQSNYDAEVKALVIMMDHLQHNCLGIRSCIILTDSATLVNNFLKFKRGVYWDTHLQELHNNIFVHKVTLLYIPRHLNVLADQFSKDGSPKMELAGGK